MACTTTLIASATASCQLQNGISACALCGATVPLNRRFVYGAEHAQTEAVLGEQLLRQLLHFIGRDRLDAFLDLFGRELAPKRKLAAPQANHAARRALE